MSNLNFDYVPLTFISNQEEIKKQIRNTLILIHLFKKYNSPVRLEKLIEGTQYGYNASALQSGKNKFLRISDIHDSKVNWETVPFCNCDDEKTYLLEEDDVLIARTGGTTGKSFKIDNPPAHSIYAGYLIRIRAKQEVNPDYIYLFLHSFAYWSQIVNLNERNFRPKANAENLKSLILPDCPKNIQNDAVKISNGGSAIGYEELYSEIEKALAEYDKTQEVQKLLSDQITQLENLNQTILQEAVQGKLVPHDPNDEPASELLKRIKAEKAKSGKKEKTLPSIKPEEIPFAIPENWVWCRLGEICSKINDGTHHSPANTEKGDFKYVTAKNIKNDGIDLSKITYINKSVHNEIFARCNPSFGDILYIKDGATTGIVTINNLEEEFSLLSSVALLKLPDQIFNKYLMFAMRSPFFYRATRNDMYGVAITRVTLQKINNLAISLPPLSEQKRIVAEIERQLAKTKQLKEHIITNQQATEQLLKALLHQAFEVEEIFEKPKEKAIELQPNIPNWDNLVAEPLNEYATHPINKIQNIDWEMALMVACMKSKLGVTYGDVGLQKTVFNTNHFQPIFSKQYDFTNSNFGTYSHELKEDLKRNPYLSSQKVAKSKEVYVVNPKYNKQILDKLTAPENKEFVHAINRMLSIYEHPFINKETDKIELYNTVLKIALDKSTRDIDVIYKGMNDWKVNQAKFKTKAEKFTKPDSKRMLNLLIEKGIL